MIAYVNSSQNNAVEYFDDISYDYASNFHQVYMLSMYK